MELINQKLNGVRVGELRELARSLGLVDSGQRGVLVARLLREDPREIDKFIKSKYRENVRKRQTDIISDADLLNELRKVKSIDWGVVQGQLDGKIQREHVRPFARYDELISSVEDTLHDQITSYTIASWYNHWSTILIEDYISQHPNVVPTLKNIKGVDIFFRDHPFDLKITYIPRNYDLYSAIDDPVGLAQWLYENQGVQRFGNDPRLYVVLADTTNVERSWELKRDANLLYRRIDDFLDSELVDDSDTLQYVYNGRSFVTSFKILLITQS